MHCFEGNNKYKLKGAEFNENLLTDLRDSNLLSLELNKNLKLSCIITLFTEPRVKTEKFQMIDPSELQKSNSLVHPKTKFVFKKLKTLGGGHSLNIYQRIPLAFDLDLLNTRRD